jgi:hypothetical protein
MRAAALTGVVFALCLIGQFILTINTPSTKSSAAKITSYYLSHKSRIGTAGLLTMLAVAFGLGFFLYLRTHLRRRCGVDWLPSLFFTGGVIFAISGAIGGGLNFALADSPEKVSPSGLQTLNMLSQNLSWVALSAGLALMYAAIAIAIVRTGMAPRWVAWVAGLMAVLGVTFFLSFIPFLLTPIWVLVVSIRMATRNPVVE